MFGVHRQNFYFKIDIGGGFGGKLVKYIFF